MTRRAWLLLSVMCGIWGIPYLLIKVADEGVSVTVLVLARTAIGAALLAPLTVSRDAWRPVLRRWKPVLAFAFFEMIAAWLLLADAERRLPSSTAGLMIASAPILAAVLDQVTGGERISRRRMVGLGTGLFGVALLAGPAVRAHQNGWPITELVVVAFCYAVAPWIAARYLVGVPSLPMTTLCLSLTAAIYAIPAAKSWPSEMPTSRVLVALLLLAAVCTAAAFIVFFALISEVGPSRALLFTYANPAVALIVGAVMLGEPITAENIGGLALILIGSALATGPAPEKTAVHTEMTRVD